MSDNSKDDQGPGGFVPIDLMAPGDRVTLELVKLIGIVMTREHETRREYIGQILNDLDELKRNYKNLENLLTEYVNGQPTE